MAMELAVIGLIALLAFNAGLSWSMILPPLIAAFGLAAWILSAFAPRLLDCVYYFIKPLSPGESLLLFVTALGRLLNLRLAGYAAAVAIPVLVVVAMPPPSEPDVLGSAARHPDATTLLLVSMLLALAAFTAIMAAWRRVDLL